MNEAEASEPPETHLSSFEDARQVMKHRELRQGLYEEGRALMEPVIVNLHGPEHLARRRLENRLFRRDTFLYYEREVIPAAVEEVLSSFDPSPGVDLLALARRTMMILSIAIAGVDRQGGIEEFEQFYSLMGRLALGSTLVHATIDRDAARADGLAALAQFEEEFFTASLQRRRGLLAAFGRGELTEDALPRDVLTTLLRNQDELDLPYDVILREVAYFPWVGSFSTSDAFVHAMDHLFEWLARRPEDRATLSGDPLLLQRFVHESLRLHPASPENRRRALATVRLASGVEIPEAGLVIVDLRAANRDPAVFGEDAEAFNPYRRLPEDVAPWGLTFGHGFHACLGQELAGGLAGQGASEGRAHLFGAISTMARILLERGVEVDPDVPPTIDEANTRRHFSSYPVLLGAPVVRH